MDIEEKLDHDLKQAMRAKDRPLVQAIRQVRSKLQEATHAEDFVGPMTDAKRQQVIGSYVKQLEKSCVELAAGGERGAQLVAQYQAEVDYLRPLLPQPLTDDELRQTIDANLVALGVTDARQAGKVLGALMKAHPGRVDANRARTLVGEALAARAPKA